ncbi:HPr kinase/phosphorylase [Pseudemcibacter aquimaris]|uniref:HPr kinase/phosphorylase n=1 Tax=Pseudemcibacter aquimaris TaxID=2857064 RepID=UPI0020133F92|nr:HPr kinase/phosphatase C-terminal domain-containing protein [Pseudemcibacter aquimaris]MCC3860278.1 HPr kinase/phosphatase C-terminal domain-containing protein [Pseudemcibacter aquimaris]WDU57603.1 HPr kinase/phosphatase C-terminal domain-containing protein [Pseudemcibacter aquimaris]
MALLHATCVCFQNKGILIMGDSGSGKSDLALRIIDAGGILVSDDYVEVDEVDGNIVATTAPNIEGMIEVRGVGLINVDYQKRTDIDLVINLVPLKEIDRLPEEKFYSHNNATIPMYDFYGFEVSAFAKLKVILNGLDLNE